MEFLLLLVGYIGVLSLLIGTARDHRRAYLFHETLLCMEERCVPETFTLQTVAVLGGCSYALIIGAIVAFVPAYRMGVVLLGFIGLTVLFLFSVLFYRTFAPARLR